MGLTWKVVGSSPRFLALRSAYEGVSILSARALAVREFPAIINLEILAAPSWSSSPPSSPVKYSVNICNCASVDVSDPISIPETKPTHSSSEVTVSVSRVESAS